MVSKAPVHYQGHCATAAIRDVNRLLIFRLLNFFIVLVFFFRKSIIATEIALGSDDQFARHYA